MRQFVRLLLAALMILVGTQALAAQGTGWNKTPECTGAAISSGSNPPLLSQTESTKSAPTLFFCPLIGTAASVVMKAEKHWDFCFDPDTNGTAGSARVFLRSAMFNEASTNSSERVHVDKNSNGEIDPTAWDGDTGGVSLIQNRCLYDIPPGWYYFEVSAALTGSELAVVRATIQP